MVGQTIMGKSFKGTYKRYDNISNLVYEIKNILPKSVQIIIYEAHKKSNLIYIIPYWVTIRITHQLTIENLKTMEICKLIKKLQDVNVEEKKFKRNENILTHNTRSAGNIHQERTKMKSRKKKVIFYGTKEFNMLLNYNKTIM